MESITNPVFSTSQSLHIIPDEKLYSWFQRLTSTFANSDLAALSINNPYRVALKKELEYCVGHISLAPKQVTTYFNGSQIRISVSGRAYPARIYPTGGYFLLRAYLRTGSLTDDIHLDLSDRELIIP